ncbi:MAG: hypothetical protein JXA94_01780 [Parachlamydiales bacterium]|nr:hypothetical protein [Parachlamydiales bacterium]
MSQIKEKSQILGKALLYIIIVYLFYQIFENVKAPSNRLWYFAMTQGIILSTMPLVLQISNDIRSNQITYFLLQPVNFLILRFSEAIGASILRYIILIILCLIFVPFLKGEALISRINILFSVFLGILGIILYTQISLLIGILSYWIKEIKTLLYFNLTATFCFGGLIVPIQLYPKIMQKICFFTPYPWILWWPANFFSAEDVNHISGFTGWIIWNLVFILLNGYFFKKYKNNLVMDGG